MAPPGILLGRQNFVENVDLLYPSMSQSSPALADWLREKVGTSVSTVCVLPSNGGFSNQGE